MTERGENVAKRDRLATVWRKHVEEDLGGGQIFKDDIEVCITPGFTGRVAVDQDFLHQLLLDAGYELVASIKGA